MKKLIIAGAALSALLAGQAAAAAPPGFTPMAYPLFVKSFGTTGTAGNASSDDGSGGDGVANWYIYGSAASYCTFGKTGTSDQFGGTNVTINTQSEGASGNASYNGHTSDGSIFINQLQGPNDRANGWSAFLQLPNSICNSSYTVTAQSTNGGLLNNASYGGDAAFTPKLDYQVQVGFAGHTSTNVNASNLVGSPQTLVNSTQANAGNFTMTFTSVSDTHYLLAGNYTDNVLITLAPNTGGIAAPITAPAPITAAGV